MVTVNGKLSVLIFLRVLQNKNEQGFPEITKNVKDGSAVMGYLGIFIVCFTAIFNISIGFKKAIFIHFVLEMFHLTSHES